MSLENASTSLAATMALAVAEIAIVPTGASNCIFADMNVKSSVATLFFSYVGTGKFYLSSFEFLLRRSESNE